MGWILRSDKVALVKERRTQKGGIQQVRWQVAQYKIAKSLAIRGKTLDSGLDKKDFEYLTQEGFTISENLIEMIQKLGNNTSNLKEIKDCFLSDYEIGKIGLKEFFDAHLKIDNYGSASWNRFFNGEISIEDEVFQIVCDFLGFDCDEIGTEEPKTPHYKQLETLLWKFNHNSEVGTFRDLATKSHNLVCLKLRSVPGKNISLFWLLKALVQPVDGNIKEAKIVFSTSSLFYSDSRDKLNTIIQNLRLPEALERKQDLGKIAKAIYEKMQKEKKNIILCFYTEQKQQLTEFYDLFNLLHKPLEKELSTTKNKQKLLMVWIDSQPQDEDESEAFNLDDDSALIPPIHEMYLNDQFNNNDIMEWTKLEAVNRFIQKTRNSDSSNESYNGNNIAEFIWNQSQGKPEVLLESVYSLCNIKWEEHQGSWRKI